MIDAGWLAPAGVPDALLCEICDDVHSVDVVYFDDIPRGMCRRTAETFAICKARFLHRVDGTAFTVSLARALHLDGDTKPLLGFEKVWRLGARRLNDTRVAFFFTPGLDRLDAATTVFDTIYSQSRAMLFCLLVASEVDEVRLLQGRNVVIRLRDIVAIAVDGQLTVDEPRLLVEIFPEANRRSRGRPPLQRSLILPLLHELHRKGIVIDDSNQTCRAVQDWFRKRNQGAKIPVVSAVRSAILAWLNIDGRRLVRQSVTQTALKTQAPQRGALLSRAP